MEELIQKNKAAKLMTALFFLIELIRVAYFFSTVLEGLLSWLSAFNVETA